MLLTLYGDHRTMSIAYGNHRISTGIVLVVPLGEGERIIIDGTSALSGEIWGGPRCQWARSFLLGIIHKIRCLSRASLEHSERKSMKEEIRFRCGHLAEVDLPNDARAR